jgi:hypothetical protein
VGVFGKLPEERDLYHETTTLLINQLRAHPCFTYSNTNLIKGSIHQQTAPQCITGDSWTCRQNELKASFVHNNEPRRELKGSGAGQNSTGRQTNSHRKKNFSLDALHGGENKRNEKRDLAQPGDEFSRKSLAHGGWTEENLIDQKSWGKTGRTTRRRKSSEEDKNGERRGGNRHRNAAAGEHSRGTKSPCPLGAPKEWRTESLL